MPDGSTVMVVSFGAQAAGAGDGAVNVLAEHLRARGVEVTARRVLSADDVRTVRNMARDADRVLICTRAACRDALQGETVRALIHAHLPAVVLALQEPFDILEYPSASTFVSAYGDGPLELEALANALTGASSAPGRLPVEIAGVFPRWGGLHV
jgi:beta-N-acetylhexosaminidase